MPGGDGGFLSTSVPVILLTEVFYDFILSCFIEQVHMLPPLSYSSLSLLFSLSPLHVCLSYFVPRLLLLSFLCVSVFLYGSLHGYM